MELNEQIKKYRTEMNISQEELAEKIYVTRQSISNWENGKTYPDIHSLLLLSSLFGISLDQLVKGDIEIMKKEIKEADKERAEKKAIEFLNQVFDAMKMQVQITAEFKEDALEVNLEGEDMGVLIGKRGQTLDSLQYLVSLVVNKEKEAYIRVKLDTENYRSRRKETLENLAKNIAFKVKRTKKPVFLEPMNPYERRVIHSALQNDPYVTTHSEGEEPYRKVVVTLKK